MLSIVKLVTILFLFIVNGLFAQAVPLPPQPMSEHHSSSSSISVKSTNSTYKFRAYFDDELTSEVKAYLKNSLNSRHFSKTNNATYWEIYKNDDNLFKAKVSSGVVRLYLDKDLASRKFKTEVEEMGKDLRRILSGVSKKSEMLRAKAELERAKKLYENAKQRYEEVR